MQYFRLKQDPEYLDAPVITDAISKIDRRHTTQEQAHKIAEMTLFFLDSKGTPDFIDLLSRQLFLVSEELKQTFTLYLPKLPFKMVILTHRTKKLQKTYYLPIFDPIECLSEKSIMTPDKSTVRHLVLREASIKSKALFRVKHSQETIIVARLDAAESILRRKFRGIKLEKIELE